MWMYRAIKKYVGKEEYEIGNIETGIDKSKRENLIKKLQTDGNDICKECEIKKRCKHTCGCLNILTTGDPKEVSPLICETERMIIEISDKLAERLYKEKVQTFYEKCNLNNKYNFLVTKYKISHIIFI